MKTNEQITSELNELNNQYKAGGMSYKAYKSKFSKIKSYNSVANQVKRFGAKVVKSGGGYEYVGKNFSCDLFLDGCETDFWTAWYKGNDNDLSDEVQDNGFSFETKADTVYYLLTLDRQLNN
tara:strand:+ start:3380 stop:3745 length:366 start_codon:yes stop_codon:yes gene_type:complete